MTPGTLGPLFAVFIAGFAIVVVVAIAVTVYRANKIVGSSRGESELEAELQLALEKARADAATRADPPGTPPTDPPVAPPTVPPLGAPSSPDPTSMESKLAELADLHARHLITDEELAIARAKVLAG